jgi:hypothetical protein
MVWSNEHPSAMLLPTPLRPSGSYVISNSIDVGGSPGLGECQDRTGQDRTGQDRTGQEKGSLDTIFIISIIIIIIIIKPSAVVVHPAHQYY